MIETVDLTAGYESGFAVRDVTLGVSAGQILGIIGPNGAGKTTLLRAMTRALDPQRGRVLLEGRDVRETPLRDLAAKIAVVSQTVPSFYMGVEEFVLLGRLPHFRRFQFLESRGDREMAEWAMKLSGAWVFRDRLVAELSGGERQLVLIARALAQKPRLLLLDEPIAHLDIGHQVEVLDLLRRLNQEFGLTIVMVLHDLNLAAEYCHVLALLHEGRLRKVGTPDEVLDFRTIEEVYKTVVLVRTNEISSKPFVIPVPADARRSIDR